MYSNSKDPKVDLMNIGNVFPVLINGKAGAGKTATAKGIVWPGGEGVGTFAPRKMGDMTYFMNTYALASPLAEMKRVKTDTTGKNAIERQLWLIDDICDNLFPKFSCAYEDYVELVYDIVAYPLKEDSKNRDFYTQIGDRCNELYKHVFIENTIRNIIKDYKIATKDDHEDAIFIPIISDTRLQPELDLFKERFNTVNFIKLDVSEHIRQERLQKRDNEPMRMDQSQHPTASYEFSEGSFDLIVNGDTLDLNDQVSMVRDFILNNVFNKLGV